MVERADVNGSGLWWLSEVLERTPRNRRPWSRLHCGDGSDLQRMWSILLVRYVALLGVSARDQHLKTGGVAVETTRE